MPVACLVRVMTGKNAIIILGPTLASTVDASFATTRLFTFLLHTGAVWHILGTVTGIGGALLLLNRAADDGAEHSDLPEHHRAGRARRGGRVTKPSWVMCEITQREVEHL
jgi:hypothetical protein